MTPDPVRNDPPPQEQDAPVSEKSGLLSGRKAEPYVKGKQDKVKKWLATALLVAGIALIIAGILSGVGLGFFAVAGTVTIGGMAIISFSATPFAIALSTFTAGIIGGSGCLIGYSRLSKAG